MSRMYNFRDEGNDSETVDIYVYSAVDRSWNDEDDSVSASDFQRELAKYPQAKQINVYINSIGGSVMEGTAIYTQLKRHKAKVTAYVDGFACSIASVIAMAADEVVMGKASYLMIHNPWTWGSGNAKEFRKLADTLDKLSEGVRLAYTEKCGDKLTEEKLTELLDEESYITASEAVEWGFADRIVESEKTAESVLEDAVASIDVIKYPFMARQIDRINDLMKKQAEEKQPKQQAKAHEVFMSFFNFKIDEKGEDK